MTDKVYQVGVIGYGLSAKVFQIPFFSAVKGFAIGAIVQRSGDDAARENLRVKVYRSADQLFGDPDIDVVVVSTPPSSHFSHVSSALHSGKHVVVEKPFCPSSKECDELISLAKAKAQILTVFQNRRWDADYVTLQTLLKSGELGRIVEFESHFDRFDPEIPTSWAGMDAPGGGVIYDLGTHLIDQVLHCFGLPAKVTGFLSSQRAMDGQGPADACTVLLHYDSGLLVTLKASTVSPTLEQLRFLVRGTKGGFQKYHLDPQESHALVGMKTSDAKFGVEDANKAGIITILKEGALQVSTYPNVSPPTYKAFYDILFNALEGKCDVPVSARDARNVIKIVELAKESSKKGVTISIQTEEFA